MLRTVKWLCAGLCVLLGLGLLGIIASWAPQKKERILLVAHWDEVALGGIDAPLGAGVLAGDAAAAGEVVTLFGDFEFGAVAVGELADALDAAFAEAAFADDDSPAMIL